jgi:hypothetical protein
VAIVSDIERIVSPIVIAFVASSINIVMVNREDIRIIIVIYNCKN